MGPTALRPIRRTKQLWLSVLLKDTSAATGQAGIRTHILATPELESNALDRSATTLHYLQFTHVCVCAAWYEHIHRTSGLETNPYMQFNVHSKHYQTGSDMIKNKLIMLIIKMGFFKLNVDT